MRRSAGLHVELLFVRSSDILSARHAVIALRISKRRMLPPVVCVIVHHGERGWNAPTSLHELVEGIRELPELERLVPEFQIIVDDLIEQGDEALKRRPLETFPKVVLWALRDARTIQRWPALQNN